MSSLPGYKLEDFILWNYNLTADNEGDANMSLGIAVALGNIEPRRNLSRTEFAGLVKIFETHRESIEMSLSNFDEDSQSWRDYAGYSFDEVAEGTYKQGSDYLSRWRSE